MGVMEGILYSMDEKKKYGFRSGNNPRYEDVGWMFITNCSENVYEKFKTIVELEYPDMCVFDYHF